MDGKQLLETGVVIGGMSSVLYYLNDKTTTDTDMAITGYLSCSFLLVLLHQVAPLFHTNPSQKTEGIYRSSTSSGLWCSVMIPSICVLAHHINKTDDRLDSDLLCILLTLTLTLVHYNPTNMSQVAGALLLLWLKENFKTQDGPSLILCTLFSIIYYMSMSAFPQEFPKSFTYGEIIITLQLLFVIGNLYLSFLMQVEPEEGRQFTYFEFNMIKVAMLGMLAVFLATLMLYILKRWTWKWKFYVVYSTSCLLCLIGGLPRRSLQFVLFVLSGYIKEQSNRMYLLAWYGILSIITVLYMKYSNTSVSTSTRKLFHLIIIAVYLPGFLIDVKFLLVASMVAFVMLVAVETIRYMQVPPLGDVITKKYMLFTDKQDEGPLIVTPIYLLLGMSLPLWLSFLFNLSVTHISIYSGLISVCIGDGVASVVGSRIGRIKWPGCHKTVEGSLSSLVAQTVTLYYLHHMGGIRGAWSMYTFTAVCMTTLLEAVTTQIDNLVLPLFLYLLLILDI